MSAPLETGGWDKALRQMAHHTGSARGELVAFGGAHSVPFNWISDATDGALDEFLVIGGGDPEVNWRVGCAAAPFEIASEIHYDRIRSNAKCDIYNDFVERHEMPYGCQTVLLHEGGTMFGLAALRTRADGPTTEAQREAFAEIAPFALAATRMQHALEHQGAALLAGMLETMRAAAFVCDGRGRVAAMTPAAEAALRGPHGLRLVDDRLLGRRPDEDRALQSGINQALECAEWTGEVARFWLRGGEGPASGQLCEVFALPQRQWSFGFEPRVLVVIREPTDLDGRHRQVVAGLLELTPAEADVALLAAGGLARDEIAQRRGTSFETVNAQMKSLYRKADVSREAELVALLNRLMR